MQFYNHQFKAKLINLGYKPRTIEDYITDIEEYRTFIKTNKTKEENTQHQQAYSYYQYLHKRYKKKATIRRKLQGIKLYCKLFRKVYPFEFVYTQSKVEEENKYFYYSEAELKELYRGYKSEGFIEKRNKVLLGLYVFQGIKSSEVKYLETKDIDLEKYTITIRGDGRSNERRLRLQIEQILLLKEYIEIYRRELIERKLIKKEEREVYLIQTESKGLLMVSMGKKDDIEGIVEHLRERLKKSERSFISLHHLRESVIRNWLKSYDVRKVQYLSGHANIGTTERFKEADIEQLKTEVMKYFPL